MAGIVDALWALDLLAGRMRAVGADFVLAGPVSLWLQGAKGRVEPLFLLLVSSRPHSWLAAEKALSIATMPAPWPREYDSIIGGRIASVRHRDGWRAAAAADPLVEAGSGLVRVRVASEARRAPTVLVGDSIVRLAPPGLELLLRGEAGGP